MSIDATHDRTMLPAAPAGRLIHPLWVRVTHWVNALAMLVMIASGWQIYNASPLFAFTFPNGDHARRLARRRAAVAFRGDVAAGGERARLCRARHRHRPLPAQAPADPPGRRHRRRPAALSGHLAHDDLSVYNAVQKLLYLGVILAGIVIVLSGLSIWKPVQLQELTALFGGYDAARYVHFFAMAAIVGFLVVHVVMALLVPKACAP